MSKCAELLQHEIAMDFVDINIGCPINLVFNKVVNKLLALKGVHLLPVMIRMMMVVMLDDDNVYLVRNTSY